MIEESIKNILLEIEKDGALDSDGELREGLRNTPKRVVESWKELYSGYGKDPKETLDATFNGEGYDGIVLLKMLNFTLLVNIICYLSQVKLMLLISQLKGL